MCKFPNTLKKNINIKETPVSYLYSSDFTIEKDIEEASLHNKFTAEKPP